jgi:hypothetical protein
MSSHSNPPHIPEWVPVRFDTATVQQGSTTGSYILKVFGETPSCGERSLGVRFVAHKKYLVQPEYWEISVEWDRSEAILQSTMPYEIPSALDGILGSKGIEVFGRGRSEKIDVP